jgi:PKD repeat protein
MKPLPRLVAMGGCALLTGLAACNDTATSPTPSLTATCSASPVAGMAPLAVVLSVMAEGSSSFDVSVDFGDGTRTSEGFFASSVSFNLPHVYQAAGGYTATFSVTGADGQSVACSIGINVTAWNRRE